MDSSLTWQRASDAEVIAYIDDDLLERLKDDDFKSVYDFIHGFQAIAIKSGDRTVGIVSFRVKKGYAIIHPKIRRDCMIYAQRCCIIGLDYIKNELHRDLAAAFIPEYLKSNARMALACGMRKTGAFDGGDSINGRPYMTGIYVKEW
jgi:hypothetical protein